MNAQLDATLAALADPTRRAILARLARGEATVNQLVAPFSISQPAISRHLRVLEDAGLILRRVDGARRPCRLAPDALDELDRFLAMLRKGMERSYQRLDQLLARMTPPRSKGQAVSKLSLRTDGDTAIVITRHFDAPPEAVYRAHLEPALLQQWCLGPDGWTMPVCISDPRPGGAIRYEWRHADGKSFYLTGELVALEPPHRIVHIERMHLPDPTPDNRVETTFAADGAGTLMTMRMTLPDGATRKMMLATGMADGMEAGYARLDRLASR